MTVFISTLKMEHFCIRMTFTSDIRLRVGKSLKMGSLVADPGFMGEKYKVEIENLFTISGIRINCYSIN